MRAEMRGSTLIVDLGKRHRCMSSAVLGGGVGEIRTWMNLQVPGDYARLDPLLDLREHSRPLVGPVVGMMTAADVRRFGRGESRGALAWATTGVGHATAAAGRRPRGLGSVGTINILVVTDEPISETGLVNAVQTAVEAKAQALANERIVAGNSHGWATGTPTDSICVATPIGPGSDFAGPGTAVGSALARAVHGAVTDGLRLTREIQHTQRRRAHGNTR